MMSRPGLKKIAAPFVMLLCLHFVAARLRAQEAYKVAEIENPRCDLSEVPPLDPPPGGRFATVMRDTPEAGGAIIVFDTKKGSAARYAQHVKDRLIRFAGVAAERLVTIYGGVSENPRLELWIIPKGATEPKSNFVEDRKNASQFDRYIYWDGEYCGGGRFPALAEFAKELKKLANWQGYIVIRPHRNKRGVSEGDADWDSDGHVSRRQALRRIAVDKSYLVRKFGLSPARLRAVIGDNDDWTHAELWLVPPGAELPASKAQSLTKKR